MPGAKEFKGPLGKRDLLILTRFGSRLRLTTKTASKLRWRPLL